MVLSKSPMFVEELLATIKSAGPAIAVMPISLIRVFIPYWAIKEGSPDIPTTGGPMVDTTPLVDVVSLRHISMEVALASLHHHTVEIDDTSLEGCSQNLH